MFRAHGKGHTPHKRHTHSPGPTAKRRAATLAPALEQLKQDIRSTLRSDDPVPSLRQLRQSSLYSEVWTACKVAAATAPTPEIAQQQSKAAADAYTTCYALDSVVKLAEGYQLRWVTRSKSVSAEVTAAADAQGLLEQMLPARRKKLVADFRESWQQNSELRQAAILSALAPEAAAQLDLVASKTHTELAQDWGKFAPGRLLNTAELLALVDYVNSNTGTFNAVNGAAMVHAYYGDKVLSGLMQVFAGALGSAIAKLCEHPYFGKTDIIAYKGINLNNQSGQFRLAALEAAVGGGKVIAFPNVLSATSAPEKSYAVSKYCDGYTIECQLSLRKAFDADPFHDVMTMGENEVIAPAGQRFVVAGKQAIEVFEMNSGRNEEVTRFVLEPAPPPR